MIQGRQTIKQRILTGLVLLPLLILLLIYSGTGLFLAFMSLVAMIAQHEFQVIAVPGGGRLVQVPTLAIGLAVMLLTCLGHPQGALFLLAGSVLLLGALFLFHHQDILRVARDLGLSLFGICYLPLLLAMVVLLFSLPGTGRQWVGLVLLVVMLADTCAYFVGSAIGRTPLYPAVSPKKSCEGAIGGLVGSLLGGVIAQLSFFPQLGWGHACFAALLLSIMGQLGDLFESLLKRSFQVKDSSQLIPGHGGLLDRLDSLLFAFPTAYFYATLFFGD